MKGREVVGNASMDTIEEDGSLSPIIFPVLQTSSPVSKVFVLRKLGFMDPIDLS